MLASGWALATSPIVAGPEGGSFALAGKASYWVEPGRTLTVGEVEARAAGLPWSLRQPGQQDDLDGKALWIRFEAEVRGSKPWFLVVGSSGIDRVQFFRHDAGGAWVSEEAGDTVPVSRWPVPGHLPTFELAPGGDTPSTYWVRIEHNRVDFAADLGLQSQSSLLAMREREQFLMGGYFGVAALLAFVALASALAYRDRNFTAYAMYLVLFSLGQAAYLGLGAQYLWDSWLEWNAVSTFLLPGLSTVAALWFVQVVTEPARFSRLLDRMVWVLMLATLLAVLVDTWLPSRTLFGVRLVLTIGAVVLIALLIGLVWIKGNDPGIRLIALGFVPVLVMSLFPVARGLGLIPNSVLTRYGLAIGAAFEMPILFHALSLRSRRRREAQLRASALPHTDALTGLADRSTLLQHMDAAAARGRSQKHSFALLLVKLANHDAIAGEFGRETMERALVVAASHLRRAATDIDLAARVGEHEFVLLLEGPTTAEAATARAQQVVASGLRPAPALPGGLTLRLQVAMALLPDRQASAAETLEWALAALAAMRPDSRKQIRPINF
ncbi:7TM diverse intracellular signaling domain-containing protein [Ramlibacter tataouinensis]|uniref:sensor domain-containing diguanylate cyclase n=1 Tax=Ramlibacter tataouinensis TaxID=94132 RepID=UPI0022F3FD42|nr:7TM diverse intracellular signaling domain-containing protein [Ramlibacter tataouinensis]WBY00482.1 7TM diverse intracellular signaling domain-containing protein [Ramlibacter tataouinensis]